MTAPRDLLTSWSEALAEEIVAAGVRHAVVSPGSRSTPFVAAALAAGLQCDSVIDERAAGFFALGLVRATRRPVLLLCTSGTAPAHYLPAVLEAAQSELPLLVLSADRPLELMDCDAPQTIQQMNLFGEHVRGFFELGEPVEGASAVEAMSRRVALAVHRSRWPLPGPVHLNARAKKPLEPQEVTTQTRRARGRVRYGTPTAAPDPEQVRELARLLRRAERPLVTAGSGLSVRAAGAVASLVQTVNAVLAAEAASGARTLDLGASLSHFPLILESPRVDSELAPDLVVQLGRAPIARRWPERLASWCEAGARHVVLTSSVPSDVAHTASEVVVGDVVLTMAELEAEAATEDGEVRSEWREAWASADERVRRLTETEHRAEPGSEAALARRLVDALGAYDASVLSLSNSLPVRLVDHQAGLLPAGMRVLSQRGVSGIDGLIAGLAGFVAGAPPLPTALLLGDVALLHDLGSLSLLSGIDDRPVVVAVLNNQGGRIFEQLPIAKVTSEEELAFWTTPHQVSFRSAAAHAGLDYVVVEAGEAAGEAFELALGKPGVSLVELRVPPQGAAAQQARLVGEIAALEGLS